jgi:hypothetical protein
MSTITGWVTIGFTGTRIGMGMRQLKSLEVLLRLVRPQEVRHGDCVGADAEFHSLAQEHSIRIVIHPPDNDSKRAFCHGGFVVYPKPYLERNKDIVVASDIVFAAPSGPEKQHSGTWMTVRLAKGAGKDVVVIYPDGHLEWRSHSSKTSMFINRDDLSD